MTLALLVLAGWWPATAASAVRTVQKCDGHPDGADAPAGGLPGQLRNLINDASAGDLIVIPAGCTITLVGPADDDDNQSGDLDIRTTLTIQGAGPGHSILDGGGIDRVVDIPSLTVEGVVAFSGLTIRGGSSPGHGGGLYHRGEGTLRLTHVVVTGNQAVDSGGGILTEAGSLDLRHVTVTANAAGATGGGILHFGTSGRLAALRNVTLSGNRAERGGGGLATGTAPAVLEHVSIVGNRESPQGGRTIHRAGGGEGCSSAARCRSGTP